MKKHKGYIAITSVLVISAIVFAIIISVSLFAVSEMQISFSEYRGMETGNSVESCVEVALLYLNDNDSLPSNVVLPQITCTTSLENHTGSVWTFTVSGVDNGVTKTFRVSADRTDRIYVLSWEEI